MGTFWKKKKSSWNWGDSLGQGAPSPCPTIEKRSRLAVATAGQKKIHESSNKEERSTWTRSQSTTLIECRCRTYQSASPPDKPDEWLVCPMATAESIEQDDALACETSGAAQSCWWSLSSLVGMDHATGQRLLDTSAHCSWLEERGENIPMDDVPAGGPRCVSAATHTTKSTNTPRHRPVSSRCQHGDWCTSTWWACWRPSEETHVKKVIDRTVVGSSAPSRPHSRQLHTDIIVDLWKAFYFYGPKCMVHKFECDLLIFWKYQLCGVFF